MTAGPEDVLGFWFPAELSTDRAEGTRQVDWWFRGGADAQIIARFSPLLERAARGELDGWSRAPRSRLALIAVLDQFSRTLHRGTAGAFSQDPKAAALTIEGLTIGHYAALGSHWEKLFFALPLAHSENPAHLDRVVELTEALIEEGPPELRWWLEFSASQALGHRDVIRRFGRHPHRNEALGRPSTPEELEYVARGEFVHTRSVPR